MKLPGIAVDIDNPSDLQQLVSSPGQTRAQRLARKYVGEGTVHVGTSPANLP
jgi:2-phospho-L-lactate guanylyltransferase (CobY/MobA/RfbA family)